MRSTRGSQEMAVSAPPRPFKTIRALTNNARSHLAAAQKLCDGADDFTVGVVAAFRSKQQAGDVALEDFVRELGSTLQGVKSTIDAIENQITGHLEDFRLETWQESERRKEERADKWKSWFQGAIRWVLGAAIAIAMYSTAVNLAEAALFKGWIHVPVHDWLTKHEG